VPAKPYFLTVAVDAVDNLEDIFGNWQLCHILVVEEARRGSLPVAVLVIGR
jgi:hypothetical protein